MTMAKLACIFEMTISKLACIFEMTISKLACIFEMIVTGSVCFSSSQAGKIDRITYNCLIKVLV